MVNSTQRLQWELGCCGHELEERFSADPCNHLAVCPGEQKLGMRGQKGIGGKWDSLSQGKKSKNESCWILTQGKNNVLRKFRDAVCGSVECFMGYILVWNWVCSHCGNIVPRTQDAASWPTNENRLQL